MLCYCLSVLWKILSWSGCLASGHHQIEVFQIQVWNKFDWTGESRSLPFRQCRGQYHTVAEIEWVFTFDLCHGESVWLRHGVDLGNICTISDLPEINLWKYFRWNCEFITIANRIQEISEQLLYSASNASANFYFFQMNFFSNKNAFQ